MDMQKTVEITLAFPVQLADKKLEKVTIRRPTVGDILDFPVKDGGDISGEVGMLAHLCGLHKEDIRSLDLEDYAKLQRAFVSFRDSKDAGAA